MEIKQNTTKIDVGMGIHFVWSQVSWIRKSDSYLLTVDRDTFIADSRFESLHLMASDTWTLHIRNVRPEDQGSYECQVSSEPKTSLLFQLNIICK